MDETPEVYRMRLDITAITTYTLVMLVVFESTLVMQRIRQLKEIRSLQTPPQTLQVYRHGKWDKIQGEALLPGDLISIGRATG